MSEKMLDVTKDDFQSQVLESDLPVLVDFWAEWCAPCKMIEPIVDEIAGEYEGKLRVVKVEADANQEVLIQYGVMNIPTLILFKGGEDVARLMGYQGKDKVVSKVVTPFV